MFIKNYTFSIFTFVSSINTTKMHKKQNLMQDIGIF